MVTINGEQQAAAGKTVSGVLAEMKLERSIRGVAFAALLGLSDFRKDAFAVGIHAGTHPFLPHKAISPANARLIFV